MSTQQTNACNKLRKKFTKHDKTSDRNRFFTKKLLCLFSRRTQIAEKIFTKWFDHTASQLTNATQSHLNTVTVNVMALSSQPQSTYYKSSLSVTCLTDEWYGTHCTANNTQSTAITDWLPNLFTYANQRYNVKYILLYIVCKIFPVADIQCCYCCMSVIYIKY